MSGLSRIISSLSQVVVLSCFVGCATFHSPFDKQMPMPKATATDPVAEILCLWQPGEGSDPDGVPCKGFTGQIIFLNRASKAVVMEGEVRVYLFDDQGTAEEQTKPLRQFNFSNGAWGIHLTDSAFGPSYNVFIPYVRRGTTHAACALRVRLKPKAGPVIFSDFSNMALNGYRKSTKGDDAKPFTKDEVDVLAADALSGTLRRTTTISTGTNPQTEEPAPVAKEIAPVVKKDANPNQVQLASHEVESGPTTGAAEADRIRRLESMVEKLLEQKANSVPASTTSTRPRRDDPPAELDERSEGLEPAAENSRSSRRLKIRRNDDEASIPNSRPSHLRTRRAHPLDDDQPVRSRSNGDDEFVQEQPFGDASDSNTETTYLPRDATQSQRYQRSSR